MNSHPALRHAPKRARPVIASASAVLLAAAVALAILWPSLPAHSSVAGPGPVLLQAKQAGVLKVALRSYARPSLPGDPLPAEPDTYDQALADWLGQLLQVRVQLATAPSADLVLEGVANDSPQPLLERQTSGSYMPERLQLLALKQQAPQWSSFAPGHWKSWLPHIPSQTSSQPTVCFAAGLTSQKALQSQGLQPRPAPSSIHAISDFLAGKCNLLAESPEVVTRLLQQGNWRFYTPLGNSFRPKNQASIELRTADAQSAKWLQQAVQQWQRNGRQQRAQANRVSTIALEVSLLEDGAICH